MAVNKHPRFVDNVTVPARYSKGFEYNGRCYPPGAKIPRVPIWIAACFSEYSDPKPNLNCFPSAHCNACGGTQIQMYRDLFVLEAGVPKIATVPNVEGCGRPACVQFVACDGGCLLVDYDTPVALPEGDIVDGMAPDLNPIKRDICTDEVCEIHMVSDAAMIVQLIYTGCC